MSTEKTLGPRLLSAIPYIERGATVADIGTDHAYLPIELIRRGLAEKCVACDINQGPIERAREHIRAAGMEDRIATKKTDGLQGVEDYHPTHILIFGMGGELIARILEAAPWIKDPAIHLILQPMTKAEALRGWLAREGFSITGETLTYEEQYYQTIAAHYTGASEDYTEVELLVGKWSLWRTSPHGIGFLDRKIQVLFTVVEGKKKGGEETATEEARIRELLTIREELT